MSPTFGKSPKNSAKRKPEKLSVTSKTQRQSKPKKVKVVVVDPKDLNDEVAEITKQVLRTPKTATL